MADISEAAYIEHERKHGFPMALSGPTSDDAAELLERVRTGDTAAENQIFEQYVERLLALAQSRLNSRFAARIDPEDVVMSAYRSFFVAARAGRFCADDAADLCRLLVEVTLHKLFRQVQRHKAQKRSIHREDRLSCWADIYHAQAPTPEDETAAADELEFVLSQLPDQGRRAVEMRLQEYELGQIAERLGCSERTIGRWLAEVRRLMVTSAGSDFIPSAARSVSESTKLRQRAEPRPLEKTALQYEWSEFLMQEQIGQGATGRVYRAVHKATGKLVAIKFLRKSLSENASIVERFVREAEIVRKMSHPGIVAIHGLGRAAQRGLFLVMEHVSGSDLDRISRAVPFDRHRAASWVAQAARIMDFAHGQGVIHCDLKPGNLLLDDDDKLRVTDFGFASPNAGLTASRMAGTPSFMAPEQIEPSWGAISPRTDVWGLGGVLLYLLSGEPPNRGSKREEVLAEAGGTNPVTMPNTLIDEADPALVTIVRLCLVKNPTERFGSAQELASAIEGL